MPKPTLHTFVWVPWPRSHGSECRLAPCWLSGLSGLTPLRHSLFCWVILECGPGSLSFQWNVKDKAQGALDLKPNVLEKNPWFIKENYPRASQFLARHFLHIDLFIFACLNTAPDLTSISPQSHWQCNNASLRSLKPAKLLTNNLPYLCPRSSFIFPCKGHLYWNFLLYS